MMRIRGLIRTVPAASAAMCASMGTKCLICSPDQATLTMIGMPLGECRLEEEGREQMNRIIYIVGLVVIVLLILGFLGLR